MNPRRPPRKVPLAKRRELEVAAAVAREEVMQFHVASALQLVELAAARVSATRMVDIYLRLQGITGSHAELVLYGVLATLGQSDKDAARASLYVENEEAQQHDATSLLRVLRGRLRGRVHHDLRRWVELANGTTQVRLLEIHVRHAKRFTRDIAESHNTADACALYSQMAGVPESLRDILYAFVLDRIAGDELPAHTNGNAASPARVAMFSRKERSKRAV